MIGLKIKNMVCDRCIEAVTQELNSLNIHFNDVQLGGVEMSEEISPDLKNQLAIKLEKRGFELLLDKQSQLIEKVKNLIIKSIYDQSIKTNYSVYLEKEIGKEYSSISQQFSSAEGITIERFIILQKIERAKELISYDELSLSQISYQLGYSSVQHLSNQFKKHVGQTPTVWKSSNSNNRKPLDSSFQ